MAQKESDNSYVRKTVPIRKDIDEFAIKTSKSSPYSYSAVIARFIEMGFDQNKER